MKIENDQIASTELFGMLDGKPVNLMRLKGGLNMAVTVDSKGNDTVLGAASHQAILCYSVEQRFPSFQPAIMKSEGIKLTADSHSHFLSDDLRKSGHDIYSVQNGNDVEFFVTKLNIRIGIVSSSFEGSKLLVKSFDIPGEFSLGVSSALSEKALCSGVTNIIFSK
jgi:hypothetical protein